MILITSPFDFVEKKNEILNDETIVYAYGASRDEVLEHATHNNFLGWVCSPVPEYPIDSSILEYFPNLKVLASPSTGSNHIDRNYLEKNNITFFCLKNSEIVNQIYASSEFTFALLIAVIRKLPLATKIVHQGRWRADEEMLRGRELHGLRIGIIGYGRIGSNLAKYCHAFSMKISAYDPYVDIENKNVLQVNNLDQMLPKIDILACCVHLNNETQGMINEKIFSQLPCGSFFINTSRGEVVNEADLLKNLKTKHLQAAGLDVISDEFNRNNSDHPLIKYSQSNSNLIISPHIAGLTFESETKAQLAALNAVKKILT